VRSISEQQQSLFELLKSDQPDPVEQEKAVQHLEQLKKVCLECSLCDLRDGCRQVVFGDGNPHARLMLVGEGPGADEDRLGIPFVGRAGQLLNRILEAAEIERDQIYIANVVKCRPPANRLPLQAEVDTCLPHLKEQIKMINPDIIVCLGSLAARTLIDKSLLITRSRGQWHEKDGRCYIATFHPAALLRDPGKKKAVWEDFKQVMKRYHKD
jgi:uracil-DNA glycosylase